MRDAVCRFAAAAVLVGVASGCADRSASQSPQMTASRSLPSLPTAPTDVPDQMDDGSTQAPEPMSTLRLDAASRAGAASTAGTAMRLFARPTVDAGTWVQDLQPLLSAKAAQAYRHVDPANVAVTKLTGQPRVLPQETPKVARVSVPTDVGVYLVVLSRTDGNPRWVVERFTPPEEAVD